jgi:hypothetical protein
VFEVETRTVAGRAAAVGSAGPYTLVADEERLRELVEHVDRIAEIPNSLRGGTDVTLAAVRTETQR